MTPPGGPPTGDAPASGTAFSSMAAGSGGEGGAASGNGPDTREADGLDQQIPPRRRCWR